MKPFVHRFDNRRTDGELRLVEVVLPPGADRGAISMASLASIGIHSDSDGRMSLSNTVRVSLTTSSAIVAHSAAR